MNLVTSRRVDGQALSPKERRIMSGRKSTMSEEKKLPNARCARAGHSEHMCTLADQYFHINCAEEYRAMVKDPEYKCQFCGHAAKSAENLCYPTEL